MAYILNKIYSMKNEIAGISTVSRKLLGALLQASKESFTVAETAQILNISRSRAISLLAMWTRRGWLHRVRQGIYIPVSLQATTPEATPEEPWLIAHKLFSPCYIGGWTAAHHWGLTEQIFNSVYVMTTKKIHQREQHLNGVTFKVKTILPKLIFGNKFIWSGKVKIEISDPTKTVIDGLNNPAVLGGIRMTTDILAAYIRSKDFNEEKLFEYAIKMQNSAVFKRLGFLIEYFKIEALETIIQKCKANIKSGYSQLDPAVKGECLVTRWGLWIPK